MSGGGIAGKHSVYAYKIMIAVVNFLPKRLTTFIPTNKVYDGLFPKPRPNEYIFITLKGEKRCLDLICIKSKNLKNFKFLASRIKFFL